MNRNLLVVLSFIVIWCVLNLVPVMHVTYDMSIKTTDTVRQDQSWCSLNYLTCMDSTYDDNYPVFLKSTTAIVFIIGVLPLIGTGIVYAVVNRRRD